MYKYRLRVILILVFGGCLMVGTRLFYLQVIQREHWEDYAKNIRLSRRSSPTHRGRILALAGAGQDAHVVLAADLPAFDIALKLSELDLPKPKFRRSLYRALRVDGLRVRDRDDVDLVLVQTEQGEPAVKMHFSGVVLRRKRPSGIIGLVWKGKYVRDKVEEERLIPILDNLLEPVRNLSELTGRSTTSILKDVVRLAQDILNNRANSWDARPVIEDVPYSVVLKVAAREDRVRGFFARDKRVRRYSQGELAGHIVGYMAKLNPEEYNRYKRQYAGLRAKRYFLNDSIGRSGIESRFNEILRGERGEELVERDRRGRTMRELKKIDSVPGSDIYLTILAAQQRAAENALANRVGSAVVLDARNGEILVLASAPRYDPATFSRDYRTLAGDPRKPLVHKAVKSYPLGSAFKMVTALAAWDNGVSPEAEFECTGRFSTYGPRCAARWGHGSIGFHIALKKSCNVYFCEMGAKAGADKLYEWAFKLGYDRNTAFEPAGEHRGYAPSPARRKQERGTGWWRGDTANYSIGQGELLVTPLQAARAVAVACTDGTLVIPHIVKRIVDADGTESPVPDREPIGPEHVELPTGAAERIRKALVAAVHERGGTGNRAFGGWDKPYRIAGKTSTAERPGRSDLGWFVGIAPAEAPRIAFAVAVDLREGEHGGDAAAPIARRIIESFPDEFLMDKGQLLVNSARTTQTQPRDE